MPVFSPFIGYIPLGLPFFIIGIFNYSIYFCLSWESGVWVPIVMAVLAATSAASFPGIPTCDGTQFISTSRLLIFAVSSRERIFIVISGRDFEVPDFIACMALRESVRITDFGIFESIIHCTAC